LLVPYIFFKQDFMFVYSGSKSWLKMGTPDKESRIYIHKIFLRLRYSISILEIDFEKFS